MKTINVVGRGGLLVSENLKPLVGAESGLIREEGMDGPGR